MARQADKFCMDFLADLAPLGGWSPLRRRLYLAITAHDPRPNTFLAPGAFLSLIPGSACGFARVAIALSLSHSPDLFIGPAFGPTNTVSRYPVVGTTFEIPISNRGIKANAFAVIGKLPAVRRKICNDLVSTTTTTIVRNDPKTDRDVKDSILQRARHALDEFMGEFLPHW